MAETSFLKRNWKLLLNIVTFVALALVVYASRHQLAETLGNLTKVNYWVLLLMLPLEVLGYHAQARMYQSLFGSAGSSLRYKTLMKVSLELNFVNHVFPSGGVSGISYFGLRLKGLGVRGSQATVVQSMRLILQFLSFEVLLFIGMFALALHGKASNFVIFIGTILAISVLVATAVFMYIIGSNSRIDAFLTWVTKVFNRIIHLIRPRHPETISIAKAKEAFGDFHATYVKLRAKSSELKGPFWWAFVYNLTEVLVIYVVYVAFGEWVNIGAIILAFAIANFAGLISVVPGGYGIYEGLMTAVLAVAGIPPALSLPVTVMYRVLNTLLQVPPGYVLYHRAVRRGLVDSEVPLHGPI